MILNSTTTQSKNLQKKTESSFLFQERINNTMASEQMPRREDKVLERETHFETHRVVDQGKGVRESDKREKERELVADRARAGNIVKDKEVEGGRRGSGGGGGVHHVRKFETKGEEKRGLREKAELERRTKEVEGREWNKEEKQKSRPKGKVEAEKARPMEKTREEAKGTERAENKCQTKEVIGEERGKREENKQSSLEEISKKRGEAQQKSMNAIGAAKERYEKEKHAASEAAKERNMHANEEAKQAKDKEAEQGRREREGGGGIHRVGKFEMKSEEQKGPLEKEELERRTRDVAGNKEHKQRSNARGKVEAEKARPMEKTKEEAKGREKAQTKKGGGEEQGRGREENEQPSLEEISKYRAEAQQKSINTIEAAKERHERAKQSASEAAKERNTHANEEAKQAKDLNREKGQQGNVKVKAEDERKERGQKGYGGAKDTIGTMDHATALLAEKAKSSGGTAAQYLGEKATQAKDATVETGKSAAKVAADLKDKAVVTGWSVAQYSTEMTVEGTKAATNVVKGAAEYAGQKASELAAKSVDTAKGLAPATGENAKEYTARNKVEAKRDLEAKREAQNQERPSAKTTTESFQRGQGQQEQDFGRNWEVGATDQTIGIADTRQQKPIGNIIGESIQGVQTKGSEMMTSIGETLGNAAQTIKKPLDIATDGGREVLGAVGETVVEIGGNMAKPAQKVQHQGEEGKGGSVFNAIGETIAEIAETTKVIVAGEGEKEIITSHEYDLGNQGNLKLD